MTQEPHKSNTVLIIIAIIGILGTVITVIGNYSIEKVRQETELTKIALISIATQGKETQMVLQSTVDAPVPTNPVINTPNLITPVIPESATPPPTITTTKILGENLLKNSSFESPFYESGWIWGGQITTENNSYNGTQAVCSTQNNVDDGFLWIGIAQDVPVVAGQAYSYKAWLKWDNAAQVNMQIWWNDIQGKKISEVFPACCFDGSSGGWLEKGSEVVAPPAATSARLVIFHGVVNNSTKVDGSKICIDDVNFAEIK